VYRQQFPIYPPPEGFEWVPTLYAFDGTNTPGLFLALSNGQQTDDIPLLLDNDADYYVMAIKASDPASIDVLLKSPFTDPLSDDFVAPNLWADNFQPTAIETPGLYCPAGSALLVKFRKD
jgi:hypothetical protein